MDRRTATEEIKARWQDVYPTDGNGRGKGIICPLCGNGSDPVGIAQVEEAEEAFGQFYPNPATTRADIKVNMGNGGNYAVTVIDNMGRTLHTSHLQTAGRIVFSINTGKLASGIYTVVFSGNGQKVTRRLVVQ